MREATTTENDPLARSGDSWEQLLVELRREAVADTLSLLDSVWRYEETGLAA